MAKYYYRLDDFNDETHREPIEITNRHLPWGYDYFLETVAEDAHSKWAGELEWYNEDESQQFFIYDENDNLVCEGKVALAALPNFNVIREK